MQRSQKTQRIYLLFFLGVLATKRLLQILDMKWIQIKVIFDFENTQLATDLIADIFYEQGITGLVVEAPDIEHPEDWGKDAITPDHNSVIGYLLHNEQSEKQLKIIQKNLACLEKKNGILYKMVCSDVDESDWSHQWKAYFRPEKITDTIVVKPTWREYSGNHNEIILEIDPGMAFGTGIHPTTRMCIEMIERYLKPGDSFLDVGTGSGILMVAAAKLGAGRVWGTDTDEVAVDVAGTYVFQLIVNDGTEDSVPDSAVVAAQAEPVNSPPVANAGPDQNATVGDTVVLDGSGSTDVDGDPLSFSWSLTTPAGSVSTLTDSAAVSPSFEADVVGDYVAQLIVNDGTDDSAADSVRISAPPPGMVRMPASHKVCSTSAAEQCS